jgi:membrane protein EpsK
MTNKSFSKQLPINLISNVGVFLVGIVINLFLTPFYIKHIGLEGLGLIRLALILPVYTGLVSLVISKSVGRFLTIDLQNDAVAEANQTLNTAFFSITAILLFLIPIIFILSFNIQVLFDIPSGLEEQAKDLFLGVLLASVIGLFTGLFMIPAYANNRLDVANLSGIVTKLLQPALIVFLLVYVSMDLSLIGYAYLATSFVGLTISIFIWKKFAPQLSINYKFFHMEKLKEMTATGSWIMINQLGAMFFLYIDLIVINIFFGSAQTGEYSTVLQWSTLLRSIASVFVGVLGPMIMISYAKKHMEKIIKISTISVKMLGLLMAIPIGIISGFASPLLTVWLGESFAHLAPLMWLMILPLTINLSILPLFNVQVALNQVKIPGLFSLFVGIGNLLLTLLFIKIFDMGIYSVALASAIMLIIKNFVFTPIYTSYILGLKKTFFFKYTISGFALSILIFLSALLLQNWIPLDSWFDIIGISVILGVLSLLLIWFLLLNNEEKEWILQIIKRRKGSK